MKKKKIERWDEHLVIAVMVVSAICILIMLTSFISVTGKASTGIITSDKVLEIVNKNMETFEGEGTIKCDYLCGKKGMYAFISYDGDQYVENHEIMDSEKYTCSCIKY